MKEFRGNPADIQYADDEDLDDYGLDDVQVVNIAPAGFDWGDLDPERIVGLDDVEDDDSDDPDYEIEVESDLENDDDDEYFVITATDDENEESSNIESNPSHPDEDPS